MAAQHQLLPEASQHLKLAGRGKCLHARCTTIQSGLETGRNLARSTFDLIGPHDSML